MCCASGEAFLALAVRFFSVILPISYRYAFPGCWWASLLFGSAVRQRAIYAQGTQWNLSV